MKRQPKYMSRVQHWDDERSIGNSIIVTLNKGWQTGEDQFQAVHVFGADTVAEAKAIVKNSIHCNCSDCK